ncbi:MAG TPA: hypothetical protein VGS11_12530 [Candidatus Bathyarchaeia archaeon]|nr:hypothetical protein [Candidatus Bathyarchaeia archaeon]
MKNYLFSWRLFIIVVVVIAVAVFTVYSESQQTVACLACPVSYTGKEQIGLNSVRVNSATSIILSVTNIGSLNIGLASYYLKDSKGDMYWNQTWLGPTLSPGGSVTVNLSLTGNLTGQPFQFQSGQAYTVELVTARNNPFTYTFTA